MDFYGETEMNPHKLKGKKLTKKVKASMKKKRRYKHGSPVNRHCISVPDKEWDWCAGYVAFSEKHKGSISSLMTVLMRRFRRKVQAKREAAK